MDEKAPPPPDQTIYGIRPHLPRTPEQDRAERELAERIVRENPLDPSWLDTLQP